ncbi:hypothetical protein SSX86_015985 [Deinandra increscens subsp. villosa]|uniref:DC1 domain-containing protein n=1 Tax=Deinandra increscens subsp. villosa TaxID=3103831 RepID=A0AAP0GV80_9ASTR
MAPLQQRSNSAADNSSLQIQHFLHQHVLHKVYMTSEFNCDGCNTGGSGVRYRCSPCDFDIHEQCAASCHRISSLLHPHHLLILVNRPPDSRICYVCKGVTNGLSYACEFQTCQFNVHTLCIQIPGGGGGGGYNHHHHRHQQMQLGGGYNGVNTGQPGYQGGMNYGQPVMVNHHQQLPIAGGYGLLNNNNNQTLMYNNHYQPPPTNSSNGYSKVGKIAANILSTSLIGIPIFNPTK